jgi:hypothetical protein
MCPNTTIYRSVRKHVQYAVVFFSRATVDLNRQHENVCVFVFACPDMYVIYIHIYIRYIYAYVCIYMHIYVYICMCVCVYVCVCVCLST